MLRQFGVKVFFGDPTRPDLLHAAGIDEAKVLVVAIDDKDEITNMVRHVVKFHPHVHVVARAINREHVYDLWSVGCRDIIRETFDGSLRASRSVLEALGRSRPAAQKMVDAFADMDRKTMLELADLYDIDTPVTENKAYMARAREMREEWEEELRGNMSKASVFDASDG